VRSRNRNTTKSATAAPQEDDRDARRIPGGRTKEQSMSTDALALVLAVLIILVLVVRMR